MITPELIPQFTGDLEQLAEDSAGLTQVAADIREAGAAVHSQFQGLSAYYRAPEAEELFATTRPVQDRADGFADELDTVAAALNEYATAIRPLKEKLDRLKADAEAFTTSVEGDAWTQDGDKVSEHNQLRHDVTAAVAAFWAAERTCHNKIITLVPGGKKVVAADGSDRHNQYGFTAQDMKNAKLPWGDPAEEDHRWYEVGHWVKSFVWDGIIVDGIWGTIKGLGTLVGFNGWNAMGQAWKGLAQLATGLALTSIPGVGKMFWTLPDNKLPTWIRDSRTTMKETGKALVAWDQWNHNPARAAGAVTFNALTTVLTGGTTSAATTAGRTGALAKAVSAASTTGRAIDPMTHLAKGAGTALTKISDLKHLRTTDIPTLPPHTFILPDRAIRLPDGTVHLPQGTPMPHGATRLPNGNIKLPDNTTVLPPGTVRLPTHDSASARYLDPAGNILDHQGNPAHHAADNPHSLAQQPGTLPTAPSPHPTLPESALTTDGTRATGPHPSHEHTPGPTSSPHPPHDTPRAEPGPHSNDPGTDPDRPTPSDDSRTTGADRPEEWQRPDHEPRPLERGSTTELQIRDQLPGPKPQPAKLERALANLAAHPAGQEIAEILASGRFNGLPNYDQVVSSLSRRDMMPGGIEQLRLATRLHDAGIRDISFEIKGDANIRPGKPTGIGTDLDVMARDAAGRTHGYQFKEVQNPRRLLDKIFVSLKQLTASGADFKTFVIDTKGTLADHRALRTTERLTEVHGQRNIQFVIRLDDGILMIPPDGTFTPKGTS